MKLNSLNKLAKVAVAASAVLALAGCGVDDIQLNGKIFDAVGLNTGSVKKEAKLVARAPLVVPPSSDALPAPGTGGKADQPEIAGIQDPDQKAQTSQAELQRQQAEYCKVHYEQAKTRGDDNADLAEGPLGSCRGSVLTAIKNIGNSDDAAE
jgi:hypothetical protein